jgi:hypothetical protein
VDKLCGDDSSKSVSKTDTKMNVVKGGDAIFQAELMHLSNESSISSNKVKVDAFDVLWNRRLEELRDFHLNHGHSDVPSIYPINK